MRQPPGNSCIRNAGHFLLSPRQAGIAAAGALRLNPRTIEHHIETTVALLSREMSSTGV
jgi:hypothetical protein